MRSKRLSDGCAGITLVACSKRDIDHMVRYGDRVLLAANEVRRITRLTGEAPASSMTVQAYNTFLERHAARFNTRAAEDRARKYLIEQQRVA